MEVLTIHPLHRSVGNMFRGLKLQARGKSLILLLALLALGLPGVSRAQQVSREYQLKAVFLLNFAQFTTWPTNTFDTTNSTLTIGLLGTDPFASLLDETVRAENWNGHPFLVQRYKRVEEIQACHLLFISKSEMRHIERIGSALKGRPILTVADFDNVENREVMIRLTTQNNRIRFKINLDLVKNSNLNISSKLLRVADVETAQTK